MARERIYESDAARVAAWKKRKREAADAEVLAVMAAAQRLHNAIQDAAEAGEPQARHYKGMSAAEAMNRMASRFEQLAQQQRAPYGSRR